MRLRITTAIVITGVCLAGNAWAGVFRQDQDIHFIKDFGGVIVVDGKPMISKEGSTHLVPLSTQLRIDGGPYITYDPTGKDRAVSLVSETNLKADWKFITQTSGRIPTVHPVRMNGNKKRFTKTTEVRIQAKTGPFADWYLGVDYEAVKKDEAEAAKNPEAKHKPKAWPLILVQHSDDAVVFVHKISGVYQGAK